ncbi:hypothetical protein ACIGJO_21105 [Streptomyces sp. NPDC079020]|uniref:hypothetical protein n=1 Tax=unclassified Streptomyces TaxID=2593676 RepID=UPI00224E5C12|nr:MULTISPECIES: hypothetical protein [unclassified Streptomyces]MCX4966447.1 hypothetical protein [Streptomyces sp. NBC_00654]MEE1742608.1 hypothetical protein [Streptomyces sp. BE147]
MSNITELESNLSDLFASFDVDVAEESAQGSTDVIQIDAREIRIDLVGAMGTRAAGN